MADLWYYKRFCEITIHGDVVSISGPDAFSGRPITVTIPRDEYALLKDGIPIKRALKSVPKEIREFLISGLGTESFPKESSPDDEPDELREFPGYRHDVDSVNKAILVGRVGKAPVLRNTSITKSVCNFPLATKEGYTDKDGTRRERTEWHNIVAWGPLAEICAKYLAKGRRIYVEGRIQNRTYDDREGNRRYVSEIIISEMQLLGECSGKVSSNRHMQETAQIT